MNIYEYLRFKDYTLSQKIDNYQALNLLVCLGINQQKFAQRSIRFKDISNKSK